MTRVGPLLNSPAHLFIEKSHPHPSTTRKELNIATLTTLRANASYSWGRVFLDTICFIPKMILKGFCYIINLISCGKWCSPKSDPIEVRKALPAVIEILETVVSTDDEANEALKGFFKKFPDQKEKIKEMHLEEKRVGKGLVGDKGENTWNNSKEREIEEDNITSILNDCSGEENRRTIKKLLENLQAILARNIEYAERN